MIMQYMLKKQCTLYNLKDYINCLYTFISCEEKFNLANAQTYEIIDRNSKRTVEE